jgi:hypothetical protein
MKKITILVASFLLVGNMAKASENPVFSDNNKTITNPRHNFDEPISFVERGIEFFVFPNGEFDFNTRPEDTQGDCYYKTAGQRGSGEINRRPINYGVRIEHDAFGRVRRVGNTFINYDYNDRVSRIGTVYMRYNRFALSQIGGLQIIYNRSGQIVDMIGAIKSYRSSGYYNDNYYGNSNHYNNHNENNSNQNTDDYYYYKQDGTKSKIEKEDTLDQENKIQDKENKR